MVWFGVCRGAWSRRRVAQEDERIRAGGSVGFEVEAEGSAGGALREAGDQVTLLWRDIRPAVGEQHLDLLDRQRSQAHGGTARANGGEQLARILREDDDVNGVRRLLKDLEQ